MIFSFTNSFIKMNSTGMCMYSCVFVVSCLFLSKPIIVCLLATKMSILSRFSCDC
jgi:hypothetical protein